jgi:hypothetical protein
MTEFYNFMFKCNGLSNFRERKFGDFLQFISVGVLYM